MQHEYREPPSDRGAEESSVEARRAPPRTPPLISPMPPDSPPPPPTPPPSPATSPSPPLPEDLLARGGVEESEGSDGESKYSRAHASLVAELLSIASDKEETLPSWDATASVASAASVASMASVASVASYAVDQGSYAVDQGSYAVDQGSYAMDHGPYAVDQGSMDTGEDASSTTTAASTTSGSRDESLQGMLSGVERYNPSNMAPLEMLVVRQSEGQEAYNTDANLALLSLYQLHPRSFDVQRARQVLLLAMGHLPQPDFTLCKSLIPEYYLNMPPLADVVAIEELLEMGEFEAFWERVRQRPDLVAGVHGLESAVRDFLAYVVGSTFQRISVRRLNALLGGISGEDLLKWLDHQDWNLENHPTGEGLVFVKNQEQVVKNKRIAENVDLDTIENLLMMLMTIN